MKKTNGESKTNAVGENLRNLLTGVPPMNYFPKLLLQSVYN